MFAQFLDIIFRSLKLDRNLYREQRYFGEAAIYFAGLIMILDGVAGAVAALVLPLLLLVRQWLGWTYVMKRLLAECVDYEESGWYDGQTWEKPLSWRTRDLLVARHEVRPILSRLGRAMAMAAGLMLGGASLCQAL